MSLPRHDWHLPPGCTERDCSGPEDELKPPADMSDDELLDALRDAGVDYRRVLEEMVEDARR